jgi:putative sporulation protein YtxC
VEIQEPKFEEINILCDEEAEYMRYKLYDQDFEPIDSKALLDLDGDMSEANINSDDLLISWLITAAPSKIVIHNIRKFSSKTIDTINNVFINKVSICDGCSHCIEKIEKFSLTKLKENFNRNLDNIYK